MQNHNAAHPPRPASIAAHPRTAYSQQHRRRRRHTPCKGTKLTSDYVESLFDGFADTFEGVLVEQLEYCAPAKVAEAAINATAHRGKKYASALDAGCGTGLAGLELRDAVTAFLDGVDLSAKMAEYAAELCATDDGKVERADAATRKATGWGTVYRRVETGNLPRARRLRFGRTVRARGLCADVLCYFGDLQSCPLWPRRRRRAATSSSPSRPA